MLAMHYRFDLKGPDAVAAMRRRAVERGPVFDGLAGMGHKFILLDPVQPTYGSFYLWRNAEAAHAFLRGPLFEALVEAAGHRPEVRLLLTTAVNLPPIDPASVTLIEGTHVHNFGPRIDALDPRDGTELSLRFDDAVRGRRFELPYHARGAGIPVLPAAFAIA